MSHNRTVLFLGGLGGLCLLVIAAAVAALAFASIRQWTQPAPRVELVADCPGMSMLEAERQVTIPLEIAFAGMPRLKNTRSLSMNGRSYVELEFDHGADPLDMKRHVVERMQFTEELPAGVLPTISPLSDAQELLRYTFVDASDDHHQASEVRTLHDRLVRRKLLGVPGVAEVSTSGGPPPRIEILPDPDRLAAYGLAVEALRTAITEHLDGSSDRLAEEAAPANDVEALADIVVRRGEGAEVRLRDVATVRFGSAPRTSRVGESWRTNGQWHDADDAVQGIVWVRNSANERATLEAVRKALAELATRGAGLPSGVSIRFDGDSLKGDGSEETFWLQGDFVASDDVAGGEMGRRLRAIRTALQSFEEVRRVVSTVGPVANDRPARPGGVDVRLICAPRAEWPTAAEHGRARTPTELENAVRQRLNREIPAAQWRTTRAPPGEWWQWWSNQSGQAVVKIFGDDLQELERLAEDVLSRLADVPGIDGTWQASPSAPVLHWTIDRDHCQRAEVPMAEVEAVLALCGSGVMCGALVDDRSSLEVVLRWPDEIRNHPESVADVRMPSGAGMPIRLRDLASFHLEDGTLQICREMGWRLVAVGISTNVPTSAVLTNAKAATAQLITRHRAEWEEP